MARLPEVSPNVELTPIPQSTVSGGEVAAANRPADNAGPEMAAALSNIGKTIEQAGLPYVEAAGYRSVKRTATGELVANTRPEFSRADIAYNNGVRTAFNAQLGMDTVKSLSGFRQQFPDNPVAFAAAAESYKKTLIEKYGPVLGATAGEIVDRHAAVEHAGIISDKFERDKAVAGDRISARTDFLVNEMGDLATQGLTTSKTYAADHAELMGLIDSKVNNPFFAYTPEHAAFEKQTYANKLTTAAVTGDLVRTYKAGGWAAAKDKAQKIFDDNSLGVDQTTRFKAVSEGLKEVRGLFAADAQDRRDFAATKDQTLAAIKDGSLSPDDPVVLATLGTAHDLNDPVSVFQLQSAQAVARTVPTKGMGFHDRLNFLTGAGGGGPPAGAATAPANVSAFLLSRTVGGAQAAGPAAISGMRPELQTRLAALIQNAPPEIQKGLTIVSGARTLKHQAELYAASGGSGMVAHPTPDAPHVAGVAADLGYGSTGLGRAPPAVVKYLHDNAATYGLKFPLANENWHIELAETRGGAPFAGGTAVAAAPVAGPGQYRNAIASIESAGSGGYAAQGNITSSGDRAYGRYQVMGANIPAWTKEVLGKSMTSAEFLADPKAQDAVFDAKFGQLAQKYGNPLDAASVWFTGQPRSRGGSGRADVNGMTQSAYVQKFAAALDGGAPPPGGGVVAGPGGVPAGDTYFKGVIPAQRESITSGLDEALTQSDTMLANGGFFDTGQKQDLVLGAHIADDSKIYDRVEAALAKSTVNEQMAGMPVTAQDAFIDSLRAAGPVGTEAMRYAALDQATANHTRMAALLKDNPRALGIELKLVDPRSPAITDWTHPNVGVELQHRALEMDRLATMENSGPLTVLSPGEAAGLSAYWTAADTTKRTALLATLAGSLPAPILMKTLSAFADSTETGTLAVAGALAQMNPNPDAAAAVVRGEKLLQVNPKFAFDEKSGPADEQVARAEYFPSTALAPGMDATFQMHLDAARAVYADASGRLGDTSGVFNEKRWRAAIDTVTGGIVEFNGQKTVAPAFGVDQRRFDDVMAALPNGALAGAVTSAGTPVTMDFVRRMGSIQGVNDGRYAIRLSGPSSDDPLGGGADYAQRAPTSPSEVGIGGPFVLDLRPYLAAPPRAPILDLQKWVDQRPNIAADRKKAFDNYQKATGAGNTAPPALNY